jgi:hypothetical protein
MAPANEVFERSTTALDTLSNIWQSMLQIIQDVSTASASSLTVEPDLIKLQKARKDYEQLLISLKTTIEWLQSNQPDQEDPETETEIYKTALAEQSTLQEVSLKGKENIPGLLNCLNRNLHV